MAKNILLERLQELNVTDCVMDVNPSANNAANVAFFAGICFAIINKLIILIRIFFWLSFCQNFN